jgi:uridine kinase
MAACVGIAGGTASGKSTLARALAAHLDGAAIVIEHDWYYRDQSGVDLAARPKVNYDHPDALDTALLCNQLEALRAGLETDAPQYDFTGHTRAAHTRRVTPHAVYIVEGIHVLGDPCLRALCDVRVFVDVPADVRFIRRLRRDTRERGRTVESVIEQYLATTRPMHEEFVAPARAWAHLLVTEDTPLHLATARIAHMLAGAPAP